jgi:hypothetical protein
MWISDRVLTRSYYIASGDINVTLAYMKPEGVDIMTKPRRRAFQKLGFPLRLGVNTWIALSNIAEFYLSSGT